MALRAGTEVWDARWVRVPRWRTMGGGVLVARRSWQQLYTAGAWFALHGRQCGSRSLGKTGWPRCKARRFKFGPDPAGTGGIATGFNWFDVARDSKGARPG